MHSCSIAHACKLVDSIPLQTNRYVGWPPPIPMNYEGQIIESMVNHGVGVLMASPYWLWGILAHLQHEDVHSQNLLGSGTTM